MAAVLIEGVVAAAVVLVAVRAAPAAVSEVVGDVPVAVSTAAVSTISTGEAETPHLVVLGGAHSQVSGLPKKRHKKIIENMMIKLTKNVIFKLFYGCIQFCSVFFLL